MTLAAEYKQRRRQLHPAPQQLIQWRPLLSHPSAIAPLPCPPCPQKKKPTLPLLLLHHLLTPPSSPLHQWHLATVPSGRGMLLSSLDGNSLLIPAANNQPLCSMQAQAAVRLHTTQSCQGMAVVLSARFKSRVKRNQLQLLTVFQLLSKWRVWAQPEGKHT